MLIVHTVTVSVSLYLSFQEQVTMNMNSNFSRQEHFSTPVIYPLLRLQTTLEEAIKTLTNEFEACARVASEVATLGTNEVSAQAAKPLPAQSIDC